MIRVAVVDDHPHVAIALRALLDETPDIRVVAESRRGGDVAALVRRARPDVLLLDLFIEPEHMGDKALETLVTEVERASNDLQCEASLIFPLADIAKYEAAWQTLGYQQRTPDSLSVQAWKDAANESMRPNAILMFKQLRTDRVLRPI